MNWKKKTLRLSYNTWTFLRPALFALVLFMSSSESFSQVTSRVDTTRIRIGEQFHYEIEVEEIDGVRLPKFESDSLNRVGVVTSKIDSLKNRRISKYTRTSVDRGQYGWPGHEVFVPMLQVVKPPCQYHCKP